MNFLSCFSFLVLSRTVRLIAWPPLPLPLHQQNGIQYSSPTGNSTQHAFAETFQKSTTSSKLENPVSPWSAKKSLDKELKPSLVKFRGFAWGQNVKEAENERRFLQFLIFLGRTVILFCFCFLFVQLHSAPVLSLRGQPGFVSEIQAFVFCFTSSYPKKNIPILWAFWLTMARNLRENPFLVVEAHGLRQAPGEECVLKTHSS